MKLHRIQGLLLNFFYYSINSADRIFDVLYWPVLDILIWGFMTYFIKGISNFNFVNLILGGIILWVFVWRTSQDLVVYLLESYWSRNIYYLFSSPIRNSEIIISFAILGLIRSLVSFLLLSTLGFFLYSFNILDLNFWHAALFISILMIFGWGVGLLVSSLIFLFGTRIQVLAWSTIWIVQPFSCVFYPLSALPPWAAKIASLLPTTYVFEGLRASLQGQPLNYSNLIYAILVTLIFVTVNSFILRYSIQVAKRKGSFAKPE